MPSDFSVKGVQAPATISHASSSSQSHSRQASVRTPSEGSGRSDTEVTISEKQLIEAIEKAIESLRGHATFLQFSVHETTNRIMVKVINSETEEVIREIPPEHSLDFLAKIWEMAGLLVDERR